MALELLILYINQYVPKTVTTNESDSLLNKTKYLVNSSMNLDVIYNPEIMA